MCTVDDCMRDDGVWRTGDVKQHDGVRRTGDVRQHDGVWRIGDVKQHDGVWRTRQTVCWFRCLMHVHVNVCNIEVTGQHYSFVPQAIL